MEYFNGTHCISGREFIQSFETTGGVVSKDTYDKLCQRGHIRVLRRASRNSPALIEWASIPERYRRELENQGISPARQERSALRQMVETDLEAREFFESYQLGDGRMLPEDKRQEYITNAEVLNALVRLVNDRSALRKALGGSTRNIWQTIALQLSKLDMPHTLPENHRRLADKVNLYKAQGYISLISRKWMNDNAKKVADAEQEATIRQLMRKHQNLDNEQIHLLYNIVAEKLGWDKISAQTVGNYRRKWNLETFGARRGENAFDNAKAMLVKRKAPALPLVYWTMDGWDVELLYQKTEIGAKGETRTTYHNRLTVVVILDPCEKYPVGYAVGTHETPELIREAIRNAVNHTAELFGNRHRVHQLQTDNYGKKGLTPFYEAVADKFTPARVKNAKSKVVERYFLTLNKKYCQLMPNWSGFGITAGKDKQPSSEYLNKIRHSFPDEAGCRLQIDRIIEIERQTKADAYRKAYAELPEADRKQITAAEYLHLLGETTGYTNRLTHVGIVATIAGQKREYDTFDASFRELAHMDWTLKFDPADPSTVLAENADATRRFLLTEKHIQPMALYDRQEGDAEQLHQVKNFNKQLKANIMQGMNTDTRLIDTLFENNPQLEGTLTKLVLCDSNGQHKNNRSAARLGDGPKALPEPEDWRSKQEEYLNQKVDLSKYL